MSKDKIEIKLSQVNNKNVDLTNMSIEALESFLLVTNSLKEIVQSVTSKATYSIKKGSCVATAYAPPPQMQIVHSKINDGIEGKSKDKLVTDNLRIIQDELKKPGYSYKMWNNSTQIDERIRTANRITKSRSRKKYKTKIEIMSGVFNQIGGNTPNYHFDFGDNKKATIGCDTKDVSILKDYLYKTIYCLVSKQITIGNPNESLNRHIAFLEKNEVDELSNTITQLDSVTNLIERLEFLYAYIDNSKNKIRDVLVLTRLFNNNLYDVNELKTVLVISDGFAQKNETIKHYRNELKLTFEKMMSKV